jgi:hypothetical protein
MMRALSEAYRDLLPVLHGISEEEQGGMMYWYVGHSLDEFRPDDVFDWDRFVLFADPFIDLSVEEFQTCLDFALEYDYDEAERVVDEETEIGDVESLLAE